MGTPPWRRVGQARTQQRRPAGFTSALTARRCSRRLSALLPRLEKGLADLGLTKFHSHGPLSSMSAGGSRTCGLEPQRPRLVGVTAGSRCYTVTALPSRHRRCGHRPAQGTMPRCLSGLRAFRPRSRTAPPCRCQAGRARPRGSSPLRLHRRTPHPAARPDSA